MSEFGSDRRRGSIHLHRNGNRLNVRLRIMVEGRIREFNWSLEKYGEEAWELAEQMRQKLAKLPARKPR